MSGAEISANAILEKRNVTDMRRDIDFVKRFLVGNNEFI